MTKAIIDDMKFFVIRKTDVLGIILATAWFFVFTAHHKPPFTSRTAPVI